MGVIQCACGCGTEFEEKDGNYRKRKYVSGHNGRKYPGKWDYQNEYSKKNRDKVNVWKKNARIKRKIKLLTEHTDGKCKECGIEYNSRNGSIFCFHHRNPEEKEKSIGSMLDYSDKLLLEEISKCDLLCTHCHLILHHGEY